MKSVSSRYWENWGITETAWGMLDTLLDQRKNPTNTVGS